MVVEWPSRYHRWTNSFLFREISGCGDLGSVRDEVFVIQRVNGKRVVGEWSENEGTLIRDILRQLRASYKASIRTLKGAGAAVIIKLLCSHYIQALIVTKEEKETVHE